MQEAGSPGAPEQAQAQAQAQRMGAGSRRSPVGRQRRAAWEQASCVQATGGTTEGGWRLPAGRLDRWALALGWSVGRWLLTCRLASLLA